MLRHFLLLFILFISSCKGKNEGQYDTKEWKIRLKTEIGNISITLPGEYDTSFEWIHYTDYKRGAEYKFRMQPKKFPVNMESGFIWNDFEDTVHQCTIAYFKYPDPDTTYEYKPDQYFRDRLLGEAKMFRRTYHWIDTIRSLDNHLMLAFNYDEEGKKNIRSQVLKAYIYHKGQGITFEFVSKSPYNSSDTDFAKKSLEALKTIRMSRP